MPAAARLPLPVHRVQLDTPVVPDRQDLPILGFHGPHRAAHQLPEPDPVRQPDTLPISNIPLERVLVPHHLQEQRVWQQKLGVLGLGHRGDGHGQAVPAELLLVYAGPNHHW